MGGVRFKTPERRKTAPTKGLAPKQEHGSFPALGAAPGQEWFPWQTAPLGNSLLGGRAQREQGTPPNRDPCFVHPPSHGGPGLHHPNWSHPPKGFFAAASGPILHTSGWVWVWVWGSTVGALEWAPSPVRRGVWAFGLGNGCMGAADKGTGGPFRPPSWSNA